MRLRALDGIVAGLVAEELRDAPAPGRAAVAEFAAAQIAAMEPLPRAGVAIADRALWLYSLGGRRALPSWAWRLPPFDSYLRMIRALAALGSYELVGTESGGER